MPRPWRVTGPRKGGGHRRGHAECDRPDRQRSVRRAVLGCCRSGARRLFGRCFCRRRNHRQRVKPGDRPMAVSAMARAGERIRRRFERRRGGPRRLDGCPLQPGIGFRLAHRAHANRSPRGCFGGGHRPVVAAWPIFRSPAEPRHTTPGTVALGQDVLDGNSPPTGCGGARGASSTPPTAAAVGTITEQDPDQRGADLCPGQRREADSSIPMAPPDWSPCLNGLLIDYEQQPSPTVVSWLIRARRRVRHGSNT